MADVLDIARRALNSLDLVGQFLVEPLVGGANNKVYKVVHDQNTFCLKCYYHSSTDFRDRLQSEFQFLRYVWDCGVQNIPQPFIALDTMHAALYAYVEGNTLHGHSVEFDHVKHAIAFIEDINKCRSEFALEKMAEASEACFSLRKHVETIRKRLDKLKNIAISENIDNDALEFVMGKLIPEVDVIEGSISKDRILYDTEVADDQRIVSPSDFGFHNALKDDSGNLAFIDFEYAGIDDPAKLIVDFFCQPAVPVPLGYFKQFVEAIARITPDSDFVKKRVGMLLPLYQIKWCCIMLNEFLPNEAKRRTYSQSAEISSTIKRAQLDKALHAFNRLDELRKKVRI